MFSKKKKAKPKSTGPRYFSWLTKYAPADAGVGKSEKEESKPTCCGHNKTETTKPKKKKVSRKSGKKKCSKKKLNLKCIVQKYIENPLLLNGKKFDIRCYVLVANAKPLIALYHEGYLRLSLRDYDADTLTGKEGRIIHLTNAA